MGAIKNKAVEIAIKQGLEKIKEDPEKNLPKIIDIVKKFDKNNMWESKYEFLEKVAKDKDNNWNKFVMNILEDIDYDIIEKFLCNFIVNAAIKGLTKTDEVSAKEDCPVPWAILMDPTTACNLRCTGCWAADYGKSLNLGYDLMDRIITEGKEFGCYWYLLTGGEPLVKKDEILKLCEKHNDCIFMAFTNSTLIDEKFAKEAERVGNLSFAISVEGSEETTDARRGKGTYQKVMDAMTLLKKHKLLFGFSTCTTSANADYVISEEYLDKMVEKGCKFGWYFNYMPIGCGAQTDLLTTPEQRETMYYKIGEYRKTKPIFTIDFWNDGRFVGGCVAGGRRYMHINANGDVEPCAFIHYSNANVKDMSLLETLKQPIFKEYQKNQPFSDNLLRPCPLLDNKDKLAEMVNRCGAHSTDLAHPEDANSLCAKCHNISRDWKVTADKLWVQEGHELKEKEETKCN